ncbi:hypothetical protein A5633_26715 [Mycolicibacterium elephantis]|uniref:SDR family NAD(P)-dependent oxidoreductase n=1 Tax=Mycolicibacterium elephantis TaxID=81858 RepID=UPI0007E9B900|nr:SDR family oxidoreductase [Mycolicibacterium elephantis]OBA67181.1 hypothetical protein A5633_26715 [Mycolicibacterium elephantis]
MQSSVAIVTGSSRGIGFAVAKQLASRGAAVVINGRDPEAVRDAERALGEHEARGVIGVTGSASDNEVVARMLEAAANFGDIDVLINCAGILEPPNSSILEIEDAGWRDLIESHLHSTFLTCRAVAPLMVANKRGSIINTGSHAYTGLFGGTGYAAAKAGVVSLTKAMAFDLAEHGVRVNAVSPIARTRMTSGSEHENYIEDMYRRGKLDDAARMAALNTPPPEYVAALYAYLASDVSAGVTGRVLVGGGGYLGEFLGPEERLVTHRDHASHPPYTDEEIDDLIRADVSGGVVT